MPAYLSDGMRAALRLLVECRAPDDAYVHGAARVFDDGGVPAIGWRTAAALARRHLAVVEHDPGDDYGTIALTDGGRMLAEAMGAR